MSRWRFHRFFFYNKQGLISSENKGGNATQLEMVEFAGSRCCMGGPGVTVDAASSELPVFISADQFPEDGNGEEEQDHQGPPAGGKLPGLLAWSRRPSLPQDPALPHAWRCISASGSCFICFTLCHHSGKHRGWLSHLLKCRGLTHCMAVACRVVSVLWSSFLPNS